MDNDQEEKMKNLGQLINVVAKQMVTLRHELHRYPELAFEESRTAATIQSVLETIPGIEIRTGVAKTGIVATLGPQKKGPCIGLRSDMDCLSMQEKTGLPYSSERDGFMHGCGHDGHIACLLGAALVLSELQDELQGPVKFLFQPAEENYGGAQYMVEEGALENPKVTAIFGLHGTPELPLGAVGINSGAVMAASRYFKVSIHGRGTHAAMPHLGVDPVLIGAQIITGLQSIISRNIAPTEAGLITIPKFSASTAPNVIPERVELEGTLRALSNDTRDVLQDRLQELVQSIAKGYGGEADITFDRGYPLLVNDDRCVDYFKEITEPLSSSVKVEEYPPSLGAEDFAFYSERIPALFWWLGLQSQEVQLPSLHNPHFNFNDAAIPLAMELHCRLALGGCPRMLFFPNSSLF